MGERGTLNLTRWSWRAFITTTLGPLLVIEVVLLTAYLSVSIYSHRASVQVLEDLSAQQLSERVDAEASAVRSRLEGIEKQVRVLAGATGRALAIPHDLSAEELARYRMTAEGTYVQTGPADGGSIAFYSGIAPIDPDKAHRTQRLEPLMRELADADPLVTQVYANTPDSLCRLYPAPEEMTLLPGMDIPAFNFYYLADAEHNPKREVVWTDAYLDPAGAGWIISAIAPTYEGDELEAVVGFDVTLQTLIEGVLDLELPWGGYAVLVDGQGALLALPPAGEADFGLEELTGHTYDEAVQQDTLKPDAYDLFGRQRTHDLATLLSSAPAGLGEVELHGDKVVAWHKLAGPDWWLVLIVPQPAIYASADAVWQTSLSLGTGLVLAILVFYAVFLAVLYGRTRRQVDLVVQPIAQLREAVRDIVAGTYDPDPVPSRIEEIDALAADVLTMGRTLGSQLYELQNKEVALQAAAEREAAVQAASEARTTFFAHVSHEIRTPMNGLVGTLELMPTDGLSEEQHDAIDTARRSADALLGLVDDLLLSSRTQQSGFTVEREPFDLSALVRDVAALFVPRADAKGVDVRTRVQIGLPGSVGDALRLRQVLTNLVSNALKFTDTGSVELSAERRGERVFFAVRDTGIGIPEERQKAIFEPFTQADASTTRRYGGTGLGLTISASLVGHMGGELKLESQVGEGTTFSFDLPLVKREAPERAPLPDPASRTGASLKLLVAEDNPVNQKIIRKMLERLGHQVVLVDDGEKAVQAARREAFDGALLDVYMPVLDGRAAAERLRAQPETADLPLVALTASVTLEDRRRCQEAGFDEVLAKPIRLHVLDEALGRFRSDEPSDPGSIADAS